MPEMLWGAWAYVAVLFLLGAIVILGQKFTPIELIIVILGTLFLWSCAMVYMVPN